MPPARPRADSRPSRRAFLASAGAALLVAPRAVPAQPAAGKVRIGYLGTSSASLERHLLDAFLERLQQHGYTEGQHISIEYRWADGHAERFPALAAELVGANPSVIVTTGTPCTLAAMHATTTIPIVMTSSIDPVRSGLVASLARPGGNVTGFTILGPELEGKRLELLKQAVPKLTRVAVLWNPSNPGIAFNLEATEAAGRALQVTVGPVMEVRRTEELEHAFATIAQARPDALEVLADRSLLAARTQIVQFAGARRLPAMYPYGEYVDAGGLMSYAPNNVELVRGAATYVDKILKGAKPATLPVQEPTKFDLVINLKTAKSLGLRIPQSLQLRADRLIQ